VSNRTLFHSLSFDDVEAAMAFLTAVGFTEAGLHRDESDPSRVLHAQYNWRDTGGVMFGSRRVGDDRGFADSVGHAQCYCVVESDEDVDRVHAAALAAGATSVQAPADPAYGGRGCTVRDREGNQWSFGSYPGE
jgi:uncharacterized glyoxalase superfamily protein PhnB